VYVRIEDQPGIGDWAGAARWLHELATLYQTLALHDLVTVEAKPSTGESRITLTTNHPQVPTDARNTAWKMVELALKRANVAAEVTIHIEKSLPVQGGLGAGSRMRRRR